ncbi:thiolase family protein [Achromobacter xylosoxidans]|uniref:thiolase family protein n=1 Tax=Alcaligenes xylosoxydans xylosoxydans TaxID=85698 RepID=UPI001F1379EF|nr:thiolase family protein [Achromobacter xylosoxidans]MDZ5617006.1 thiolase family protein [Achromobacter xylosoxidans]MDZ5627917.1 thiolase family protein [Achromobacter xylosoxidans]MDZ5688127.1 thiolase family protein [Achromobacter xylosoxidans]
MPDLHHAYLLAAATTRFGRHEGRSALDLMAEAANAALAQSGLRRADIDGVLCGYATTFPHLMLATLLSEKLGLDPHYAHGMQMGGATGAAMVMLARELVRAGRCRRVLVVAGENRLTGQAVDASIQTLAQVGEADTEVPNGASVPAYYALLASAYMQRTGTRREDLAELAALMRRHAASHPHAHLSEAIGVDQVLASRPIATPLHLLDCCPISDGAVALVVGADDGPVRISGAGQAHRHQHLSALRDILDTGAARALGHAYADAGIDQDQVDYLGVYDSFTITLTMLLEELGFAPRGGAADRARRGDFDAAGPLPLNTHGGLLSFGHSGVAGGMAHVAEAWTQLAGQAGSRQAGAPRCALVHADGGVLSAHVSLVLQAEGRR